VKIKTIILIITNFSLFQVKAQKEAWNWHFERFNGLDFSGDTLKTLAGCQFGLSESSSSISDINGNVLFYSNGITLYNRFNRIVKNGTDLGFPAGINYTTSQLGTLLLKHPDNDSLIYLFSTDFQGKSGGVIYSIIQIHGNNDSGVVIKKRIQLLKGPLNEPVAAVNHQNGNDIWIACHRFGGETFYRFLLTKDGLSRCQVTSNIGIGHYVSAQVVLKYSPNGQFLTQNELSWGQTETFQFNSEEGSINDTIYINYLNLISGFEYSPNSRFLYIHEWDSGLAQIDLINKEKRRLTNFNVNTNLFQLQLGPDGRIYGVIEGTRDLLIIDKPNLVGDACNLIIKKNFLLNGGEWGLPNFNQSYFYTPSIDYKYELNCISNNIQFWGNDTFNATTHLWQIKKQGKSAEGNYTTKNFSHTFSDTGKYEIRYIASNGSRQDTVIKTITLHPKINKHFLGKDTAYAQGTTISKLLKVPADMHCQLWQDSSGLSTFTAVTAGVFICKVTNQSFCEVTDTVVISECINNLTTPSIYRSRDTLFTYQALADSFVWFKNNVQYRITKEPFIKLTDTGNYRVEAAKKGHCNRSSAANWVNRLGTHTIQLSELNIKLYPNPSLGTIFIFAEKEFELTISDITGRTIFSCTSPKQVTLQNGIYFFNFLVEGNRVTEKVVIY